MGSIKVYKNYLYKGKIEMILRENLEGEYLDIYDEFIMGVDTNIKLSDVILTDENKGKIEAFLKEYRFRDDLVSYGLKPMNRILMYGASGTGKTFLSKALSNNLGFNMLYVDIAKALSENSVAMNISNIFKLAEHLGNCMIMFDECDSIAWNRDSNSSEGGVIRRATNSIFQYLDQMRSDNVFVAATNMLHRLDLAFERRFDLKMEFLRPQISVRESVKHFIFKGFELVDDIEKTKEEIVERRVRGSEKISYYAIQGIVEKEMKRAVIDGDQEVRLSNIYDGISEFLNIKLRF